MLNFSDTARDVGVSTLKGIAALERAGAELGQEAVICLVREACALRADVEALPVKVSA